MAHHRRLNLSALFKHFRSRCYCSAGTCYCQAQGFALVQEAVPDYTALSAMPQLMKVLPEALRNSKEPPPKVQATWMLKAV